MGSWSRAAKTRNVKRAVCPRCVMWTCKMCGHRKSKPVLRSLGQKLPCRKCEVVTEGMTAGVRHVEKGCRA